MWARHAKATSMVSDKVYESLSNTDQLYSGIQEHSKMRDRREVITTLSGNTNTDNSLYQHALPANNTYRNPQVIDASLHLSTTKLRRG